VPGAQTQSPPWQIFPVPHCGLLVHCTHCPSEQYGVVPLQSLVVQQVPVGMHESLAEQYFCPVWHLPAQAAVCAMHPPSHSWGALLGQV
jgi:hypothetical protein